MAYDNPGHSENFYDDGPMPEGKEPGEGKESEGQTYVLPKAVLMGKEFEPGDELVLRIVSMHGDQIEVTYAPAKDQETDKGMGEEGGEKEMAEASAGGGKAGGSSGYLSMME